MGGQDEQQSLRQLRIMADDFAGTSARKATTSYGSQYAKAKES
jgi:hypothetical protein